MYSFSQRDDFRVVDEPLYGHYLRVTGAAHPGYEEIIAQMNCDGESVVLELLESARRMPATCLFVKHMAHHLVQLDLGFLRQTRNVFLIRDPRDMLPSLQVQLAQPTLADTGLERQWQLLNELQDRGQHSIVLDSRELLLDPESVLRQLCARLELAFDAAMLRWPAGPIAEDGVWASHWYHAVHKSTGFAQYRSKSDFPVEMQALLADCQPWYDKLYAFAIRAQP